MPKAEAAQKALPENIMKALTFGFGTAAAMWVVGYVCRLPEISAPGQLVVALFALCALGGGAIAGAYGDAAKSAGAPGRMKAGFSSGVVSSILNMLILGSLLVDKNSKSPIPSALIWIPCFILAGGLAGAIGAAAAAFIPAKDSSRVNWTSAFMGVAAAATLALIAVGGMVTSMEAGLAVTDWPNSFGSNMFLYPFSRMTGGIYFEHTHRLFGTLVGLATIAFIVIILKSDNRKPVRAAALLSLPLIAGQGLMGGLRVTGVLTLSASPDVMKPSIALAVAHGVAGQVFFAFVAALAVATSDAWIKSGKPLKTSAAGAIRGWSAALVIAIISQLILGAILRHLGQKPFLHIAFSVVPAMIAFACGFRAWGVSANNPALRKTGAALVALTVTQFCLGMIAYMTIGATSDAGGTVFTAVMAATAHQVCGAMFFAAATALAMFNFRFFET